MDQQKHILSSETMAQAVALAVADGGSFLLTVTGGSMVPALLHKRSQVELVSPGEISPGHIVLLQRTNGSLVLHRVISRQADSLIINGDAQSWTEQADVSQVLARVSRICRNGRWLEAGTLTDKLYCKLWGLTRPLRPQMFRLYSRIKRK